MLKCFAALLAVAFLVQSASATEISSATGSVGKRSNRVNLLTKAVSARLTNNADFGDFVPVARTAGAKMLAFNNPMPQQPQAGISPLQQQQLQQQLMQQQQLIQSAGMQQQQQPQMPQQQQMQMPSMQQGMSPLQQQQMQEMMMAQQRLAQQQQQQPTQMMTPQQQMMIQQQQQQQQQQRIASTGSASASEQAQLQQQIAQQQQMAQQKALQDQQIMQQQQMLLQQQAQQQRVAMPTQQQQQFVQQRTVEPVAAPVSVQQPGVASALEQQQLAQQQMAQQLLIQQQQQHQKQPVVPQQQIPQQQIPQQQIPQQQIPQQQFQQMQPQQVQQMPSLQQQQQLMQQQQQLAQMQQQQQQQQQPQMPMTMPQQQLVQSTQIASRVPQPQVSMMSQMPPQQMISQQVSPAGLCMTNQPGDLIPHPTNIAQFVICYGFGQFTIMDCPEHLVYNAHSQRCDLSNEQPLGCASNPCLNGGRCVDTPLFQFKCECPTGFMGAQCERQDVCSASACGGDGVCIPLSSGSPLPNVCSCQGGRTIGQTCATAEPNPCMQPNSNLMLFSVRFNPSMFAHCEGMRPNFMFCQAPLVFNQAKQSCDWPSK